MAALLQISSCSGHHERGAEFPVLRSGFSSAICLIRGGAQPTPLSRFSSAICLIRSGVHMMRPLSQLMPPLLPCLMTALRFLTHWHLVALWCPSPRPGGSLDHHLKQTLDFVLLLCPIKVPKLKFRFTWF